MIHSSGKNKQPKQDPATKPKDPLSVFIKSSQSVVEKYFKPVLLFIACCLLLFGLSLFYIYWQGQQNEKVAEVLYQSQKQLSEAEQKAGGDILKFDNQNNFFSQSKKGEWTKQLDRLAQEHINLIKNHIKKPIALLACNRIAHWLYQYGKKALALDLLKTADLYKKANLTGFLNSFQLGAYLLDEKGL